MSWCLDYLLWDKAEALQYLAMSFVSDAAAMLVTGALLIWSQYKINQHNFAVWHLVLAALLLTCIYVPAENALWLIPMKEDKFDPRFLLSNLDSNTLAFFVWTSALSGLYSEPATSFPPCGIRTFKSENTTT